MCGTYFASQTWNACSDSLHFPIPLGCGKTHVPLTADIICLPPRRCRDAIRHIYGFRHVEQTPTNHQLQALSQSKHCATNQMPDDCLMTISLLIDMYRTSLLRKVNSKSRSFTSNMHFEARSVDFANPSAGCHHFDVHLVVPIGTTAADPTTTSTSKGTGGCCQ